MCRDPTTQSKLGDFECQYFWWYVKGFDASSIFFKCWEDFTIVDGYGNGSLFVHWSMWMTMLKLNILKRSFLLILKKKVTMEMVHQFSNPWSCMRKKYEGEMKVSICMSIFWNIRCFTSTPHFSRNNNTLYEFEF